MYRSIYENSIFDNSITNKVVDKVVDKGTARLTTYQEGKNLKIGKYFSRYLDWFFVLLFLGLFFGFAAACVAVHAGTIRSDTLGTIDLIAGSFGIIFLFILTILCIILLVAYVYAKSELKSSQLKYRNATDFAQCLESFKECWNGKVVDSKKPSIVGILFHTDKGKINQDSPIVFEMEMDAKIQALTGHQEEEVPQEVAQENIPKKEMEMTNLNSDII